MADVPENIDAFNRVCLELLARLYDSFPRPLNIDPVAANGIGFAAVPEEATPEQSWNIGTLGSDVIEWLAEENFLRYEPDPNHRAGYFWKVRLTLKGLAILGHVPTALQPAAPKETLITRIKGVLASGAATAASESIKKLVAEIFKYALAPEAAIAGQIHA
jgi:hypothetical protein